MLAQAGRFGHLLFWLRLCLGAAISLSALPAKSDPFASAWSVSAANKAQMRLISGGSHGHGNYNAAVEIKLAPQAITYWRAPGDAGVPPTFSFAGSQNLADAQVSYPAPVRINEQGLDASGYRGDVIFPVAVTARDATKPVQLHLTLNYAVCDNICLPAKGSADLLLPQDGGGPESERIAAAQALVPQKLSAAAVAREVAIGADAAAPQPRWILTWKGAEPVTDLFVEAPDGWDIASHRLADGRFALKAVQQPLQGAQPRISVRLTLTAPRKSYEFTRDLDLPAQASAAGTK